MTPQERRTLQIVGGVLAAVFVLFVIVAIVTDDPEADDRVSAGPSTTGGGAEDGTTTSTALPDLGSLAEPPISSTTAPPPAATAPPASTTSTPPAPTVGPQGAVLAPPSRPSTRTLGAGGSCESMGLSGWDVECGFVEAKGGRLAWMIETQRAPGGSTTMKRATVLRERGSSPVFDVQLVATDDDGTRYTAIKVAVADVSGDGGAEIGFGFRRTGSSNHLAVDLVEAPGRVVVHRELARGSARLSTGQLDTWAADATGGSPAYVHEVIRYTAGAWRIVASSRETGNPPPSQL